MRVPRHIWAMIFLHWSGLHADPVITEFMASNQNSISDEDGFKADWIEIYNPGNDPVNLGGWSLTDNQNQRKKWVFPELTLQPKAFLVVFASSKDRKNPSENLHTNFALSAGGEYLALIKPDGITATTEFSPQFPPQFGDISYGSAWTNQEKNLIEPNHEIKFRVPSDSSEGNLWRETDFDDSSWNTGIMPLGYFNHGGISSVDLTNQLGTNVAPAMAGIASSLYQRLSFVVPGEADFTSLKLRINHDDGYAAFLNGYHAGSSQTAPLVGNLSFSSGASTQHSPVIDENDFEETDLSHLLGQLTPGENLLAIHGLNAGANSSDFYQDIRLIATVSSPGMEYGYFMEATPGDANGESDSFRLPQVISYSRPAGTFTTTFSLSLSGQETGQQIRYILADPSSSPNANLPEPGIGSTLYAGPIPISSSKVIRAAVFDPITSRKGPTKTAQYLLLETGGVNNTSSFSSPIPIVVVDHHGGGGYGPGEEYKPSFFHVFDRNQGIASLNSTPSLFTPIKHRVRGSSSAHFPKRAFAMKPQTESRDNRAVGILGMAPEADWVWYNPWKFDDVYVRNAFMFQISRDIGRWAPRTQPVEMFLNVNGGKLDYTDYHGVYVLTEKIESGSDRLDIESIGKRDIEGDALTGAYVLKIDRADDDETSWTTEMAQAGSEDRIVIVEPEQEDEDAAQVAYIQNFIASFEAALLADRNSNWQTRNYRKYIDVTSWVDVHMLNAFSLNPDSFRLSSYFHKDRNGKLKAGPIWDFDRALFADVDVGGTQVSPREWNGTHFDMSWWKHVWRDPEFIQGWIDRWWQLREGPMSDEHLANVITSMGEEVGNTVGARDATRWPGVDGNTPETGTYLGEIGALRDWLTSSEPAALGRTNWIDSQVPRPPVASLESSKVPTGTTVTLSGQGDAQSIRFTQTGKDPRPVGGGGSSATIYNDAITINQTTVITARRYKQSGGGFTPFPHGLNSRWSAPLTRVYLVNEDFATAGDLSITEIHSDPSGASLEERSRLSEPTGSHFEYIEIRNTGTRVVNTYGIRLAEGDPAQECELSAMTLAPGDFALIVKNREAFLDRFGLELEHRIVGEWGEGALSNDGESIRMISKDGSLLLERAYEPMPTAGASWSNPGGGWKLDAPSPGAIGPSYSIWRDFHYPGNGFDAADHHDTDGDGADNLTEYARGTHPLHAENQLAFAPVFEADENRSSMSMTFRHPIDRPSAAYQVEFSTDLSSWEDIESTRLSVAAGEETRQVSLPISSDPAAAFLRFKTTVTP